MYLKIIRVIIMGVQMPRQMAYDRAIVVFSPEGKLYQVEYAAKAVSRSSITLGVTYKNGVVLAAAKPTSKLLVSNPQEKISLVDDHIIIGTCGILSDSRVMVDFARVKTQVNRITYDEPIQIRALVKEIADRKQRFTQMAGLRPYGISMLVAGATDSEPHLFETNPSGALREWKASAMGKGSDKAEKVLKDGYKSNLTKEKAIALAVEALKAAETKLTKDGVEMGLIEDNKGKIFSTDEIKKYL